MNSKESNTFGIDVWSVLIFILLVGIGWLCIYSSSYSEEHSSVFDFEARHGKQMIWILSSVVLALVMIFVDPRVFPRMSMPLYFMVLFLLVLVLVLGSVISGSKSWIDIGAGIRIQPSEFAKYSVALVVAKYLSSPNVSFLDGRHRRNVFFLILLPMGLILLQKDTGSAVVFASFIFLFYRLGLNGIFIFLLFWIVALFVATLLIKQLILLLILIGIATIFVVICRQKRNDILRILAIFAFSVAFVLCVNYIFNNVLRSHQKDRINVLIGKEYDPKGSAYNVDQSLIAIGSGGFAGRGFMNGTQTQCNFVPAQSTDFIYCTVGEESGFLGSVLVLFLYTALLFRIIIIAERQRSDFTTYYAYAVAGVFFVHYVVNIGMTIAFVPVIGIPLPFMSYGGSSLWAFTVMLFTLLRLDMYRNQVL